MNPDKLERPLFLDMDTDEALARFIQTKPEEVTPAPSQKRKAARPSPKPKPGTGSDEPTG